MEFSLFYFAHDEAGTSRSMAYRLLLDTARFADRHGFAAVWIPERRFHPFGGIHPDPVLLGAAVAAVTERVQIRGGNVVSPGYDPIRTAEAWAMVDSLSDGRVALAFAPGWSITNSVVPPDEYARRRVALRQTVDYVRRFWGQEAVGPLDGVDPLARSLIDPVPVQSAVPVWLTSAGSAGTLREAGQLGTGLLTHLLCQSPQDLAGSIPVYRDAYAGTQSSRIAVMLPTFLGCNREVVRETARGPFLRTAAGLLLQSPGEMLPDVNPDDLDPDDLEFVVEQAFDRYVETCGLFGSSEAAARVLSQLAEIGVDEVVCMIDLDVEPDAVTASLRELNELRTVWATA